MNVWKVTLIGAALVAANAAIANVTITGQRTGVTPLPSLNLSRDLRQIAYSSGRPSPLNFSSPRSQTGEIQIRGAFDVNDPRDRSGNRIDANALFACNAALDAWCGDSETMAWNGPGSSALRYYLGTNGGLGNYERARNRMLTLLHDDYGQDTADASHWENQRRDGMAPSGLDDLDIFTGRAL